MTNPTTDEQAIHAIWELLSAGERPVALQLLPMKGNQPGVFIQSNNDVPLVSLAHRAILDAAREVLDSKMVRIYPVFNGWEWSCGHKGVRTDIGFPNPLHLPRPRVAERKKRMTDAEHWIGELEKTERQRDTYRRQRDELVEAAKRFERLDYDRKRMEQVYPCGTCNAEDAWKEFAEYERETRAKLVQLIQDIEQEDAK